MPPPTTRIEEGAGPPLRFCGLFSPAPYTLYRKINRSLSLPPGGCKGIGPIEPIEGLTPPVSLKVLEVLKLLHTHTPVLRNLLELLNLLATIGCLLPHFPQCWGGYLHTTLWELWPPVDKLSQGGVFDTPPWDSFLIRRPRAQKGIAGIGSYWLRSSFHVFHSVCHPALWNTWNPTWADKQ